MFEKFRISDEELCPCDSGKQYHNCCKKKNIKKFRNNNELMNFIGKLFKKSKRRVCLYNGCEEKGKNIIGAHAIQENRILNKLAVNGFVKMQNFDKEPVLLEIKPKKPEPFYFLSDVSINKATKATCFCKTHDDTLFAKIEKSQYDLQTLDDEQKFLFAYKTFSFELYTEMTAKKFYQLILSNIPQLFKKPLLIYQYRKQCEKLIDLKSYQEFFNNSIDKKDFSGLETITLELPFQIQFSNYMAVSPPFDITGKKLRAMDKKTSRLKFVFFTSFPVENKSYILISALKEDMKYFHEYFEQIKQSPLSLIKYYLNVFIPLYSQNLIISPRLWDSWDETSQKAIQYAVADPHSSNLLFGVKSYLREIEKTQVGANISTSQIVFEFFKNFEQL